MGYKLGEIVDCARADRHGNGVGAVKLPRQLLNACVFCIDMRTKNKRQVAVVAAPGETVEHVASRGVERILVGHDDGARATEFGFEDLFGAMPCRGGHVKRPRVTGRMEGVGQQLFIHF